METVVNDALPDSQIGHRAISLAGMMHYLQGTTLSQILDVYDYHLHFQVTESGLMQAWHRDLYPKYGKSSTLMRQDGEYREKPTGCGVLPPRTPPTT